MGNLLKLFGLFLLSHLVTLEPYVPEHVFKRIWSCSKPGKIKFRLSAPRQLKTQKAVNGIELMIVHSFYFLSVRMFFLLSIDCLVDFCDVRESVITYCEKGRGGAQVVSVLASYSADPSLNLAEVYSFYSVNILKRTKINKKRPGLANLKNILW